MNHHTLEIAAMHFVVAVLAMHALGSSVNADDPLTTQSESVTPSESTGVIEGTVFYQADQQRPWRYARYYVKDRRGGQLAEAVVVLTSRSLRKQERREEPETVAIDQKDFRFDPETVAIQAGDRVKFTNSDNTVHNVRTIHPWQSFNVNIPAGGKHIETFARAGGVQRPYRIGCDYHSSMRAWVFVLAHPHFQVTSADGRFRLKNVPPGEYELEMVHPAGELQWSKSVIVEPGKTTNVEIRVDSQHKSSNSK